MLGFSGLQHGAGASSVKDGCRCRVPEQSRLLYAGRRLDNSESILLGVIVGAVLLILWLLGFGLNVAGSLTNNFLVLSIVILLSDLVRGHATA